MSIGPVGTTPYSQMPKASRRTWLVPRRVKEGFVAFAVACVAVVAGSTALKHWNAGLERALGQVDADVVDKVPALPFSLPARGGGTLEVDKFKGKLVLVNFWASWCAPCRDEEPSLNAMAARFDPASFEVVAVSVDDDWGAVDKFFGANKPAYRVALDLGAKVSQAWGTSKFPESYLVDRDGRVRLKFIGPRNWMDPAMFALLGEFGAKRRAN